MALTWEAFKNVVRNDERLYRPIVEARKARQKIRALVNSSETRAMVKNYVREPEKHILCHWSVSQNFGDALSPIVTAALSQKKTLPLSYVPNVYRQPNFSVIGSVLQFPGDSKTEIWGSGFINRNRKFPIRPAKVHAVRGPLTRARVLEQGVDCPAVYGDPAVFAFDPLKQGARQPSYKVGLIAHYHDVHHPTVQRFASRDEVLFINVFDDYRAIAAQAQRCEVIVSSSLHGLILSDALHLPNRWLAVSDAVVQGGFKFQDYFLSIKRDEPRALHVEELSVKRVVKEAHLHHVPFDRQRLLSHCPFLHPDIDITEMFQI